MHWMETYEIWMNPNPLERKKFLPTVHLSTGESAPTWRGAAVEILTIPTKIPSMNYVLTHLFVLERPNLIFKTDSIRLIFHWNLCKWTDAANPFRIFLIFVNPPSPFIWIITLLLLLLSPLERQLWNHEINFFKKILLNWIIFFKKKKMKILKRNFC